MSFVQMQNVMIGAEERMVISSYQTLSVNKFLSDHKAQKAGTYVRH